jgi:flagellar FliL protein
LPQFPAFGVGILLAFWADVAGWIHQTRRPRDHMTTPAVAPATAPAPKSSKRLIVFLAIGVVLLGSVGAGAYWMTKRGASNAPSGGEKPAAAAAEAPTGVLSFEPFVVNLTDGGGSRFLRLNVRLLVEEAEAAERLSKSEVAMARTRSAILELLAEQSSDHLVTAAGKAELKKVILERARGVLAPAKVADVLFSDFVVQF